MNRGWIYREQLTLKEDGYNVLDYYTHKYSHSNRAEWQARITAGQILVNNQLASQNTILKANDKLAYQRSPWQEPSVPLDFTIVFEDKDLLVINKPSGLPVMPGGGFLEHTLLGQLKKLYPQEASVPIHRLGRGTSGLILIGRSQLAKAHLSKQMRDSTNNQQTKQVSKIYLALIAGNTISEYLNIDQPIGKIPHPILGYVYGATDQGKTAISQCWVIERYKNSTLLEVKILTGRPHQIRIHLATVGYPLLGDPLYIKGGTFAEIDSNINSNQAKIAVPGDCGYCLHAHSLSFTHPNTLEQMKFKCSAPW